jgi:predicted O-methyltransferase YrrM
MRYMKLLSNFLRLSPLFRDSTYRHHQHLTRMSSSSTGTTAKFQNPKFVPKQVNDYVLQHGYSETSVAEELRLETAKHPWSVMMGDPIEASMFKVLLPAIGAKKVVEVGVYTGYTTLIMAEAMGPEGKVVACDVSEEFTNIGKPYWEKAGVTDRIDLRIAPATETLQKLLDEGNGGQFDFAFIDADKKTYKVYYELLLRLIRKNGIIAIDNVLWSGKVLDDNFQDEDTVALRELTEWVHNDDRVEHVMLPFADGVTLVRKK